ncbi:MAG: PaRep2b protein, partial [Pyrobaculum sp.]|nr:PaRep2b protein [Pyrobaculum sp.]
VNRISSGDDPYVYCLAKDCAGDRIVRKFVAPALELIVLEKALDMMSKSKDEELKERIRKETLLWFGEMYATAIAGDGSVRRRSVELAIGGELGGGATLLRLAPLHLINQLLPNELKFGMRVYVKSGVYRIDAYGENAARFMRLLADSAPLAGGGHLSPKFKKLVEETQVKVEKPEEGLTLTEDWQRFTVLKYDNKGRFVIRFSSIKSGSIAQVKQKLERMGLKEGHHFTVTWPKEDRDGYAPNPNSIQQETQRLGEMGLEEGRHFSAKTPKGGGTGYVYILREGLAYAAWLSAHGEGEQKELAKSFVAHILKRAEDAGDNVYNKVLKIVEEGKKWDSLSLTDIRGAEVEVKNRKLGAEGEKYVVTVTGGGAKIEGKLLRLTITAEVNGVRGEYTITYVRRGRNNVAVAYAYASVADARRLAAVVKALTGEEPGVYQRSDGTMMIQCTKKHLEGFRRYKELAGAIEEWLEKTRR